MAYDKIFEPLKLRSGFAKNRIWTAPTLCVFSTPEGYATERTAQFYGARAAGGAGTVTIGETAVDWEYGKSHGGMLNYWDTHGASALADVVERIHYNGARASIELCHGGIWAYPNLIGGKNPIGPSYFVREDGVVVEEMTEKQMNDIADHFAEASSIMLKCGFDSVMIHAAHGWLLGAFISRLDNRRTDKYGGSMENRARFPLMVLDRIRDEVGDALNIELRFSVTEDTPLGITVEEAVEFLKMAESRVDVIHQSYGTRRDSATRDRSNGSQFYGYAYNLEYAKALKDAGIKVPVVGVGAWDNADIIEEALENDWIDGVDIGKGIIADPHFPDKVKEGRTEDIVPCLKCLKCFASGVRANTDTVPRFSSFSTNRYRCSVNPNYGREHFAAAHPAERQKHVVVVGGGPAGLRAAITAAERGHRVTVLEKSARIGGIINYADYVSFKQYVRRYRDYLVNQVNKHENIEVVLNTEGTPETVRAYQPDSLILAFGGKRRAIRVPGAEKNDVWNVEDIYGKEKELGKKVVVVGGNESGVEAAIHLLEVGKQVTIVASRSRLVPFTDYTARLPLVYHVEGKADIFVNSRVVEIEEESVKVRDKGTGDEREVPADSVVFAIGLDNQADKALTYSSITRDFHVIGDALKVADIENATKTAYDAAINI